MNLALIIVTTNSIETKTIDAMRHNYTVYYILLPCAIFFLDGF
jgi:hypothetical protein